MKQKHFLLAVMFMCLAAFEAAAGEIRVAVASNFLAPLRHLVQVFEADNPARVRISAGSTGQLYAQIVNGAPFDVFLAANAREPERLEAQKIAVAGSRFTYARGRLLLMAGAGRGIADPLAALQAGQFARIAIANPAVAPYGQAAMAVLQHLGVQGIEAKIVRGENVAQTYQFVASGNVDLGFIAFSQAGGDAGKGWLVPETHHQPIAQQAVLLRAAEGRDDVRAFLAFLGGEKAARLIREAGYGRD